MLSSVAAANSRPRLFRFGVFEFDPATADLSKAGVKISLSQQPAQLLELLLCRAGEIVTRETIQEALWGSTTTVDFDLGVNRCIRQLRGILLDDSDAPRYIETIRRRGYRFIAPVSRIEAAPSSPAAERSEANEEPQWAAVPALETGDLLSPAVKQRRGGMKILVATLAGVLVIGGIIAIATNRRASGRLGANLTPTPIFSLAGGEASWPNLSPDGKQAAFVWNGASGSNFDIYIKELGAHNEQRLTTDPDIDYSPVWSPDGRSIAFCRSSPGGHATLWVMSAAEHGARKLSELNAAADRDARVISWFPDGRWLVLSDSNSTTHQNALYLVDARTGGKHQITFPPDHDSDLYPAVSPRKTIAYVRDKGLGLCTLRLLQLKDGATEVLSDTEVKLKGFERDYLGQLAWTPDSSHIVFASYHGAPRRLWITALTPSSAPQLLPLGDDTQEPSISARGQLAYVHSTTNVNIWRVDLRDKIGNLTEVAGSIRIQDSPKVSPDGKQLAFVSDREGAMNIWASNIDGRGAVPVTTFPGLLTGSPAWSPDGSQIAFDSRIEGKPAIYVETRADGKIRKLTSNEFVNAVPAWAPDGRSIYFCSDRTGRMEVWEIRLNGAELDQITEDGGFAPEPSPDGKYLYYTRSGTLFSALWRRDLATGDEFLIERSIFDRAFAPVSNGVYYIPESHNRPYSLYFYSSQSGSRRLITTFDKPPHMGISASKDESALFLSRVDVDDDEILLINDFWR